MAVDDLEILQDELPELFDERRLPPGWDEDWLIFPLDSPEAKDLNSFDSEILEDGDAGLTLRPPGWPSNRQDDQMAPQGYLRLPEANYAGGPVTQWQSGQFPPPDALAFYLPFHYYLPVWGIYLTVEGVRDLATFIHGCAGGALTATEAVLASRVFLYGHEAYHHLVESFATRLETSHRVPLYKKGFEDIYRRHLGTDESIEEALANRHGYVKALSAFAKDKPKKLALAEALAIYIEGCPPGYRRALEFETQSAFKTEQCEFAEDQHHESLRTRSPKHPAVWLSFPHAFSGISRVTSRVNYIIHRNSPLATRLGLGLRFLRNRELIEKLRDLAGCEFVRHGRGHDIWKSRAGKPFSVPRHPGDLRTGTLAKIIRQAGLNMTVQEFRAAKSDLVGAK